ncbi:MULTISPECIES: LytR/AlgR family response regulator transcription factor [Dyadobacter]|uniref:Response regulator transcription factor n=2 Tax=Dyadobacter TaxID=120831 RepID=A0A5R9KAD0_9BACT|nr:MULTISPECIES: response regulator transcription factor [Dyadobacter]KAA6430402.1 response regulator transcription factor [Dyadobacter flavalbus]TLU91677.1 response regulator transcription factor [Dyadobacter sediminis]GGC01276.1 DNA-binding response regulator [Dyadobacter sediminis]
MNILIVEDDYIIAKHLQYLLNGFGYEAKDIASDYTMATEMLSNKVFHLAILDINLNGYQTGIDLADHIRENYQIPFLFLSSHEDIAVINAALQSAPHAFLQKPFQKITVYTAVKLALKNYRLAAIAGESDMEEKQDTTVIKDALFIKEKHMFTKILLSDILYIRSDDNYLELHTSRKKYTIRETLKNMLNQLPPNFFFRVHKSFIINLHAITGINYVHVIINDIEIPITNDNRNELLSRVKTFS